MDKRTSARLAKLAARVVKDGRCTPSEAKKLAACVLAQAAPKSGSITTKVTVTLDRKAAAAIAAAVAKRQER